MPAPLILHIQRVTFAVAGLTLAIGVESASAQTFTHDAEVTPDVPDAGGQYGLALDIDGPLLAVGAPGVADNRGSVYLHLESGGRWNQVAEIVPSDVVASSLFGADVVLEGGTLAVGAYHHQGAGAVYLFQGQGSQWSERQVLTPSTGLRGEGFGRDIALDGDLLAVSAKAGCVGCPEFGAVYVFHREGSQWVESARLVPDDVAVGDAFGDAVGLSNGVLAVGAPADDDLGTNSGSVYLFREGPEGWFQAGKLTASNGSSGDFLGRALDFDEGTLVVGATTAGPSGAVYAFEEVGGVWTETAHIVSDDPGLSLRLGSGVSLDGELLAAVDGGAETAGAVFLFRRGREGWTQEAKLIPGTARPTGGAVRVDGERVVVGAPYNPVPPNTGAAYVFDRDPFWTKFCFGDGSGTSCPCGNESLPGLEEGCGVYGEQGAILLAYGSPRLSADDLAFVVLHAAYSEFTALVAGDRSFPGVPFSDGLLCVGGTLCRLGVTMTTISDNSATFGPELGTACGSWAAGSTWNFQSWFRVTGVTAACGNGVNTSSAVALTFTP